MRAPSRTGTRDRPYDRRVPWESGRPGPAAATVRRVTSSPIARRRAVQVALVVYLAAVARVTLWPDAGPDGESMHPGDPAGQARASWAIVEGALTEAGFSLDDVVRTRMYIVDPAHADAVASVHGELFKHVRPVATLVVVARLMRDSLLVEVEADARRG